MRIHEDVLTKATPEQAWELLCDPELHELWNPRIVATEVFGSDPPGVGYRYRVTLELSGRRTEYNGEIVEYVKPERFAARLVERNQGDGRHLDRVVIETFTVTSRRAGTHVSHDIEIRNSGVNLLLRMLVWLIMKTGRPVGQTFMQRFGELAEENAASESKTGPARAA